MDNQDENLPRALQGVAEGKKLVALELRRMAKGEEPYRRFTYTSYWIKNVWRAAADLLDPPEEGAG